MLVIVDEAQELVKLKGRQMLPVLGYAYDHLRNLYLVLTGSKAGLLLRLLRLEDPGVSSIREVRREDRDKAVCQGAGA